MDKIQILTTCSQCNGKAYIPTEETIFIGSWKYFRRRRCSVCQGSGMQLKWIYLSELARLLEEFRSRKAVL
jgi:DnaJ-class molecular chaperone